MTVTYNFSGKTAVVTGGANGIGSAIAQRLASSGARVWVWDLAPAQRDGIDFLQVDVTRAEDIRGAIARMLDQNSQFDILVNDVGCVGSHIPFEKLQTDEWRRIVEVNLLSVLEVSRQVLPYMREARRGRIVNLGSLAGKQGLPNLSVYSAASAGVIAFTKALAKELADTEIRVNCIAPGPIDTDLIKRLGPSVVNEMIAASPLRRLGTVQEVAELAVWLCSDACSFNTGAVFDMSGGRAAY